MKFTFKKIQSTGPWGSFDDPSYDIKLNKKVVGSIVLKKQHTLGPYKIMFLIKKKDINEDGNPNCTWKWTTLKGEFETVEVAKKSVNDNIEKITSALDLHFLDD